MQLERKIYCHWDLVRFVTKEHLSKDYGYTLSVTVNSQYELMIFLGLSEDGSEYEVRVYKSEPTDKYVPNKYDKVVRFEENDEYITFYFDNYEDANGFAYLLCHIHPEYKKRPVRRIK